MTLTLYDRHSRAAELCHSSVSWATCLKGHPMRPGESKASTVEARQGGHCGGWFDRPASVQAFRGFLQTFAHISEPPQRLVAVYGRPRPSRTPCRCSGS